MAGHVLEATQYATARHSFERGAPQRCDLQGIGAQRPIADHIARLGATHIEGGVEIDRDAHFGQFARDRFGVQTDRLDRAGGRDLVQFGKGLASRVAVPFGRLHTRDTAPFLVDRDEGLLAPVDRLQLVGQRAHLVPVDAIAREQDVADRIAILEESALFSGQARTGDTEYGRCHSLKNRSFAPLPQASSEASVWTGRACPSAI